jgi:hypothetical protein
MSTQIGRVEGVPGLDAGVVQLEAGVKVEMPVRYTDGATIDLGVYTSEAGIELLALPCTLTPTKARELVHLLSLAIRRSDPEGAE